MSKDGIEDRVVKVGEIYKTNNFGDFIVEEHIGQNDNRMSMYRILFMSTGGERVVGSQSIISGEVRDYLEPTYCEIGYLGSDYPNIEYDKRIMKLWTGMISRCYNKRDDSYQSYGHKGVTVSEDWHDYSKFYKDIKHVDGWDDVRFKKGELQLDKDSKQMDKKCKIYSLDTCRFLTPKENSYYSTYSRQRTFSALSPDGLYYPSERNVADFCSIHELPDKNAVYESIDARKEGKVRTVSRWVFGFEYENKEKLARDRMYRYFIAKSPEGITSIFKSSEDFIKHNPDIVGKGKIGSVGTGISKCLSGNRKKYKGWSFIRVNNLEYEKWIHYVGLIYPKWSNEAIASESVNNYLNNI